MQPLGGPIVPVYIDGFRVPGPMPRLYGIGADPTENLEDEYPVGDLEDNGRVFRSDDKMEIELSSKELAVSQIAKLCLFTRKKLIPNIMHSMRLKTNDWTCLFSRNSLVGNSPFFSACIDYFIRMHPDFFSDISVTFHDVKKLFTEAKVGHVFLVAKVRGCESSFIVDLTIRQFIQTVRLTSDEVAFFDEFLKKGYIEATERNLSWYQCFFQSYTEEYYDDIKTGLGRPMEWFVDDNNLTPELVVPLEKLEIATAEIDYMNDELQDFLNPK